MLGQTIAQHAAALGALLGLFLVSVLIVGRLDGLRCVAMLVVIPALLAAAGWAAGVVGLPTLPVVLITALLALACQVFLLLGWRGGGRWAMLGAFGGFLAAAALGLLAVRVLRITGVHCSLMEDVWNAAGGTPLKCHWLVFGGIALAGAGVIADLAVAVTVSIREVHRANRDLPAAELLASGMRFGRDVISTEVNTLPLAILGASLGGVLLILATPDVTFWPHTWMHLTNGQATAVEAATLLGGTIALVLTIPITASLVSRVWGRRAGGAKAVPGGSPARRRWFGLGRLWPLVVLAAVAAAAVAWLGRTSYGYPTGDSGVDTRLVRGVVEQAEPRLWPWMPRRKRPGRETAQWLTVRTADGHRVRIRNPITGSPVRDKVPLPGDRVIVRRQTGDGESHWLLELIERDRALVVFLLGACVVVVLVGRRQGWRALAALAVTAGLICVLVLWLVRQGAQPVVATLACTVGVAALAYLIICGFSAKALCASGGTLVGLAAATLAALGFRWWLGLSGRYSKELLALAEYSSGRALDFHGLLVAATLIGALGVVMDVSIGVASAVTEVHRANPRMGFAALFKSGMSVGRKIMAAMFGAILFAYLGLNIGMFALPWVHAGAAGQILANERVRTEVFRLLAGGLAIAWTVPATALLGAWACSRKRPGGGRLAYA